MSRLLSGCCQVVVNLVSTSTAEDAFRIQNVAPERGFEPRTLRLTAACSTVELLRNGPVEFYAVPVTGRPAV